MTTLNDALLESLESASAGLAGASRRKMFGCEALFASYLSTFSETAWWLGGARAKVAVF